MRGWWVGVGSGFSVGQQVGEAGRQWCGSGECGRQALIPPLHYHLPSLVLADNPTYIVVCVCVCLWHKACAKLPSPDPLPWHCTFACVDADHNHAVCPSLPLPTSTSSLWHVVYCCSCYHYAAFPPCPQPSHCTATHPQNSCTTICTTSVLPQRSFLPHCSFWSSPLPVSLPRPSLCLPQGASGLTNYRRRHLAWLLPPSACVLPKFWFLYTSHVLLF